jgi:uncharacterized membrane protein
MKNVNRNMSFDISNQIRSDWPAIILIAAMLLAGSYFYPQLPEQVPSHWNIQGEVDRYSSRFWGAFGIPLMSAGIYLLMLVTPLIDPRRTNYAKFAGSYQTLKMVLVAFFSGLYAVIILSALGYAVSVERLVPMGVSLLIIIVGNMLGRVRHNYFVGIKLPWTLASEVVWQKTHRLAAPIWVAAGLLGLVGAFFGGLAAAILLFGSLAVAVLVPVIYSYMLYRRLDA